MKQFTKDFTLAFDIGSTFTGRQRELELLRRHFTSGGRIASISGPPGIGKSALVAKFTQQAIENGIFPGGVEVFLTRRPFSFFAFFDERAGALGPTSPALLVFDDFESKSGRLNSSLRDLLTRQTLLSVIFSGSAPFALPPFPGLEIRLSGLSRAEFRELIEKRISLAGNEDVERLHAVFRGSPLLAAIVSSTVYDGIATLDSAVRALKNFHYPAILRPDGEPFDPGVVPVQLRVEVCDANAQLLERIRKDPDNMRQLSPRMFEEVIAELLSAQGYCVTFTPYRSDGGFDMYVARKEGLGSFLYLVECKKYTPPTKVGVEVVRALHGVVQQRQANAGIIVTSSFFTKGAMDFQRSVPYQMHLRDYIAIQKWLGIA